MKRFLLPLGGLLLTLTGLLAAAAAPQDSVMSFAEGQRMNWETEISEIDRLMKGLENADQIDSAVENELKTIHTDVLLQRVASEFSQVRNELARIEAEKVQVEQITSELKALSQANTLLFQNPRIPSTSGSPTPASANWAAQAKGLIDRAAFRIQRLKEIGVPK